MKNNQENDIKTLFDGKFIKVYDLEYEKDKHYLSASRRNLDDLVCLKDDEEFKSMKPDAVTIIAIINGKLLMTKEYRYPCGQYLLSPPAGLMDKGDENVIETAIRELREETGLKISSSDKAEIINPCLFSTPGMSDESNALVLFDIRRDDFKPSNQSLVGDERIDGYYLLDEKDVTEMIVMGRDHENYFYSAYAFCVMCYYLLYMKKA